MKRTILILSLYIAGNALLLLGTDFKFSIAIIQLVIFSTWGGPTDYSSSLNLQKKNNIGGDC